MSCRFTQVIEDIWKLDLGATLLDPKKVSFRVWAPEREAVSVKLLSGERAGKSFDLRKDRQGYFTGVVDCVQAGDRYVYTLDQEGDYPDPGSRFQPDGVHGPSQVIDPHGFCWNDKGWKGMSRQDFIVYELHIGAFTKEGTFQSTVPRLDYLRDLGITALELMPVCQFPGSRNWGYDGVYPFAPQNTYGGPGGLKMLNNEAHKKGLAVILDVVYNHLGPEGNYLGQYAPYFTDRYKTPWGEAINFDGPYNSEVRHFFIANALYWINEYHIDALRLDAVHGIFDFSARHFLEELSSAVHSNAKKLGRQVSVIAESDLNDARLMKPRRVGGYGLDAQWDDDFHHALHAIITGEHNGYYEDFGKVGHLEKALREGYVYSGQYSGYRKKRHGNSSKTLSADQFIVFSQSHDQVGNRMAGDRLSQNQPIEKLKLAAGVVILSPFIPLLFMGEEYGETAPFRYFTSHFDPALIQAVREGRRREFAAFKWKGEIPDPQAEESFFASKLTFDLSGRGKDLFEFYRELIRLRKEIPALHQTAKKEVELRCFEDRKALFVRRWRNEDQVFSLYNFSEGVLKTELPLPGGLWDKVLESSSEEWGGHMSLAMQRMDVREPGITVGLAPYSFILYRLVEGR